MKTNKGLMNKVNDSVGIFGNIVNGDDTPFIFNVVGVLFAVTGIVGAGVCFTIAIYSRNKKERY